MRLSLLVAVLVYSMTLTDLAFGGQLRSTHLNIFVNQVTRSVPRGDTG